MQQGFLQPLLENGLDIITVLSSDGIIRYESPSIERMLGYTPDELIDKDFFEFIHPDDVPHVVNVFNDGLQIPDCTVSFEFRFQHQDGSWRDFEVVAKNLLDNPAVEGFVLSSRDITERVRAEEELAQNLKKSQGALEGMISILTRIIEKREPFMKGHHHRVTRLACAMAEEMRLPEEQIAGMRTAGLIHDLGKVNTPIEILSKPIPLSEFEFGMIRSHPQVGCDFLKTAEFPGPVAQILLQHHERLDGSGYPKGLAGRNILLEARILAVADVVEAMSHRRSYRSAFGIDEALQEILRNKGVLYDPRGVDACLRLFTEKGFTFDNGLNELEY
jgi:PAS domain S-box-containing protein/putative nucleotidyltransferase with HDIG domain